MISQVGSDVFVESMVNAHSHGFQYAMAGLAEHSSDKDDSFWTWRNQMYQLVAEMTLEKFKEINTRFMKKCLEVGYGHVVEFHYLHHLTKDPLDAVKCLYDISKEVGVGLTVVPIFYNKSDFGKEIEEHQKRFYFSLEDFIAFVRQCENLNLADNQRVGVGVHSLRACSLDDLSKIQAEFQHLPFHIHVSEQKKEVASCKDHYGRSPIEAILSLDTTHPNMHFVHATHATPKELEMMAHQGVHAVLCPTTEANLGDGLFPLRKFLKLGGKFSIGSDSHVTVNPWEELRWLDYQDRLVHHDRLGLFSYDPKQSHSETLYGHALNAGKKSAGVTKTQDFKMAKTIDGLDSGQVFSKQIFVS